MPLNEAWPDLPDNISGRGRVLSHGPEQYDSIRDRVVPMISEALKGTMLLGLELIGWDYLVLPMANASLLHGVAIAVRGYDLVGPGKEIMQFRPFAGWKPGQDEVNEIVAGLIAGLREARAQQNQR